MEDTRNAHKTADVAYIGAAATNADISNQDIDRFEDAFDYLTFKALISVGETCKHLEHVAGYFFHQNYSAIEKKWPEYQICMYAGNGVDCFSQYITKMVFGADGIFKYFRKNQSKFQRLTKMTFSKIMLTNAYVNCVKKSLQQLEFLRINGCNFEFDLYAGLLAFCQNLKRLCIKGNPWNFEPPKRNQWLLKTYPKLEQFELEASINRVLDELVPFLLLNPTIRKFAISAQLLWINRQSIVAAGVKFDDFSILVDFEDAKDFGPFSNLVNELYDQGFYKRLHVYFPNWDADQRSYNRIPALKALVKLYVGFLEKPVKLPALRNLEELCISRNGDISNLHTLANNFPNLKRINIYNATSDELLNFVRQMTALEQIKVECLDVETDQLGFYDAYRDVAPKIIDLAKMNGERLKLAGAKAITLYVKENLYLGTKWDLKRTVFNKIVMKRGESYEWDHCFFYYSM